MMYFLKCDVMYLYYHRKRLTLNFSGTTSNQTNLESLLPRIMSNKIKIEFWSVQMYIHHSVETEEELPRDGERSY